MKNGGAPFRTASDTDWHSMSRLSPVCTRIVPVLLRLSLGLSRFTRFVRENLGSATLVYIRKYAKSKLFQFSCSLLELLMKNDALLCKHEPKHPR